MGKIVGDKDAVVGKCDKIENSIQELKTSYSKKYEEISTSISQSQSKSVDEIKGLAAANKKILENSAQMLSNATAVLKSMANLIEETDNKSAKSIEKKQPFGRTM